MLGAGVCSGYIKNYVKFFLQVYVQDVSKFYQTFVTGYIKNYANKMLITVSKLIPDVVSDSEVVLFLSVSSSGITALSE